MQALPLVDSSGLYTFDASNNLISAIPEDYSFGIQVNGFFDLSYNLLTSLPDSYGMTVAQRERERESTALSDCSRLALTINLIVVDGVIDTDIGFVGFVQTPSSWITISCSRCLSASESWIGVPANWSLDTTNSRASRCRSRTSKSTLCA